MLAKLMKYDMKYMARILPWIYLGGIGIALILSAFILFVNDELLIAFGSALGVMMFVMAMEAVLVCGSIFMMVRIYRNMFSDEGYLTFTLPVKNTSVVNAKILTAAIWNAIGGVVVILMLAAPIVTLSIKYGGADSIPRFFGSLLETVSAVSLEYKIKLTVLLVFAALYLVSMLFFSPALYTFCCAVTHRAKKARAFASIGMFFGISYGYGILISVAPFITSIYASFSDYGGEYDNYGMFFQSFQEIVDYGASYLIDMYLSVVIAAAVLSVAFVIVSWSVGKHIVNKKLNLN